MKVINLYSIKAKGTNNKYVKIDTVCGKIDYSTNNYPLFDKISAQNIADCLNVINKSKGFWQIQFEAIDTVNNYESRKF